MLMPVEKMLWVVAMPMWLLTLQFNKSARSLSSLFAILHEDVVCRTLRIRMLCNPC